MKARFASTVSNYLEKAADKPHKTAFDRAGLWLARRARWAARLARERGPGQAEFWSGETAAGQPLRVVYICDAPALRTQSAAYLRSILFAEGAGEIAPRGSVPLLHMRAAADLLAPQADLVIVERSSLLDWRPSSGTALVLPLWVHMLFNFSGLQNWQAVEQQMVHQKNNILQARRKGFTSRISYDPAEFEMFYERMMLPTATGRFQEYAEIKSKEELRWFFDNGGLLMVDDAAGSPVAGWVMLFQKPTCYAICAGVLDGSDVLYKQGAMSAVYYHCVRWCYENGFTRFDLGGCRPFASDGVYQYKRRWGFQPIIDPWNSREWLFWAPNNAPAALDWLQAHPPVELPAD